MITPLNYLTLDPLVRILNKDDADPGSEVVIYHYASLSSFLSVLQSNRFWATNFRFLNDPTEVEYGRERLIKCLDQLICDGGCFTPFANVFNVGAAEFQKKYNDHQFIVSFTTLRDDLSFWRHYGDDGFGICFGFRVSDLNKSYRRGKEFGIDLRAVRYSDQEQLASVRSYIQTMISIAEPNDPFVETFLTESLANFAPTFKSAAFKTEEEWRLVIGNFVSDRVPGNRRPLKFRTMGRNIYPYVEVDISPNANLQPSHPLHRKQTDLFPLAEVIVGSKVTQRDQIALQMALETYGHSSTLIKQSRLPMA